MFDMSFDFSFLDNVCIDFDDSVNPGQLATKIATTNELVVQIKCLQDEVKKADHNIGELNKAVEKIKQLYDEERTKSENYEAEISVLRKQNECSTSKLREQEVENSKLSLLCDKISYDAEQKLKEELKKYSLAYKALGLQYVNQVKLLDEHKLLDGKSKKEFSEVRKKLEELCGVVVSYKSPRKNSAKQKNIKTEVKTKDASVECNLQNVSQQKEMVTKGTQYVNSTTTRACCTSTFIQKRAVGTMFPEPENLTIEEILRNTIFDLPMPISPLTTMEDEVIVVSRNIGTQTEISSSQSIGVCTNIKNIRKPVRLGRKKILGKCRPIVVPHIKLESPTGWTSNVNNLPLKVDVSTNSNVPGESSVLPLWNLMGQTIFALIESRNSSSSFHQINMLNETMEIFNRNIQLKIANKLQQLATQSSSENQSLEDTVKSKAFGIEDHMLDLINYNTIKGLRVPVVCSEATEHSSCEEHQDVNFTDRNKPLFVDSNLSLDSFKENFSHSKITENNVSGRSSYFESSGNFTGDEQFTAANNQQCDSNIPRKSVITKTCENGKLETQEILCPKEINTYFLDPDLSPIRINHEENLVNLPSEFESSATTVMFSNTEEGIEFSENNSYVLESSETTVDGNAICINNSKSAIQTPEIQEQHNLPECTVEGVTIISCKNDSNEVRGNDSAEVKDNNNHTVVNTAVDEIMKMFPVNYKCGKFKTITKSKCKRKLKTISERKIKISVSKQLKSQEKIIPSTKTINEGNQEINNCSDENLQLSSNTCDKFTRETKNETKIDQQETMININQTLEEINLDRRSTKRNCNSFENEIETNLMDVKSKSESHFDNQSKRKKLENINTVEFNENECIQVKDILEKYILKVNPISPIKNRIVENFYDERNRPDSFLCTTSMSPSSDDESDFEGFPDNEIYADCPSSPPSYELEFLNEQHNIRIIPLEPITNENYSESYSPLSPRPVDSSNTVKPTVIPAERIIAKKKHSSPKLASLLGNYLNNYSEKINAYLMKEKCKGENFKDSELVTKVRSILEHYLLSSCNDLDIAKSVCRIIKKTKNPDVIYKSIMEIIEDAKDSVQHDHTPPMPPMTETHTKLLILICIFQSNFVHFIPKFIEKIEQKLFNFKMEKISLGERMNLTLLYIGLIDLEGAEKNRARLFIYKCLYYCGKFAVPMIYYTLLTYPDVLPKKDDPSYDRSDPIISSIQSVLTSLIYNVNDKELKHRQVYHILALWYEYERVKPTKEEIIQNLMAKINCGKFENVSYSFALICKLNGVEWTENVVIQKNIIPALMECYDLALTSSAHDMRISILLESLSFILKPFPFETGVCKYQQVFVNFLNVTDRKIIQEAAVAAVLRMQRFGYCEVFSIICKWNPSYKISKYLKAMLYSFILRKPLNFWKKLENQI